MGWPTNIWGESFFLRATVSDFIGSVMSRPRLDFAPGLCDPIRNGDKVATMRKKGEVFPTQDCPVAYRLVVTAKFMHFYCFTLQVDSNSDLALLSPGKLVSATSSGSIFATIKITSIVSLAFDHIEDQLARLEGLNSAEELRSELLKFYPDALPETQFDVYRFDLVEVLTDEENSDSGVPLEQ